MVYAWLLGVLIELWTVIDHRGLEEIMIIHNNKIFECIEKNMKLPDDHHS